jgi:UDP-N-acetylmuramyl pentapeptide phosphotransferase/UDP-N-acetylglucosamine-1-phosphate transferase
MMERNTLALYILSFICGVAGAWGIAKHGSRLQLLDTPTNRSSHSKVTPKGGGIGILGAFIIVSLVLQFPVTFWLPAGVVAAVGLYGDRNALLSPLFRLIIQFGSAVVFLIGIADKFPKTFPWVFIFPVLLLFIVGTANFYNFMDGINGISSITGIVGFGLLAGFFYSSTSGTLLGKLAICLAFACLGFLPFNMLKAKVFMGDVGSILLGFVFAQVVIWFSHSLLDFISLTSFLFPFYADELTTMVIRLKNGDNLLRPHRKHTYQLLVNEHGIAHWKISIAYGVIQLLVGVSVLSLKNQGITAVLFLLTLYMGIFVLLSWKIRKKDFDF